MRRLLGTLLSNRRAVTSVEFALLAPILLLMAGATVEIGLLLRTYVAANRLAMQIAISYADCPDTSAGACQTEAALYATPALLANIAPQLTVAQLTGTIIQATMNGSTPSVVYSYPANATLTSAQNSALQGALNSGDNGVVVTVSYQQTLKYFPTLLTSYIGSALSYSFTVAQLK
jgi:Flp pilus assembly protein TadG